MIEEKFKTFIGKAYGDNLKEGSPQHNDLKDAFIGGALVAFTYLLACKHIKEVQMLQDDLSKHHKILAARAKVFGDILDLGEHEAGG